MNKRITGFAIAGIVGGWSAMAVAQPPKPQPPQSPIRQAEQQEQNRPAVTLQAGQETDMDDAELSEQEGREFLTRGPLHEAFATPYQSEGEPLPVLAKQPPEAINELPPAYQPDGKNVVWIPGYWAWDDERDDFLWVSGVWRDIPPGQRWVPGYWQEADGGFRWVSGFWLGADVEQISYLPQPPETQEHGPSTAAPDEEHFYIPGQWQYVDQDYQWVPGYWVPVQPNWVWVPSQYCWTPRGYVYQAGYWDYAINERGVLFTPVYYQQPLYTQPNYTYRPRFVVDTGAPLLVNLFLNAATRRYYYGDYYGNAYSNSYNPWVSYYGTGQYYDPLYTFYQAQRLGNNQSVIQWIGQRNNYFAKNEAMRPPRTILAQRNLLRKTINGNVGDNIDPDMVRTAAMIDELEQVARRNDRELRFRPLNLQRAEEIRDTMRQYDQDLVQQRRRFEIGQINAPGNSAANRANDDIRNMRLNLPSVKNLPNREDREKNAEPWLSQQQIQRARQASERFQSKQEVSDQALNQLAKQTTEAREYWENRRMEGRIRPSGSEEFPRLYDRERINRLPPDAPVRYRPNLSSNKGKTAIDKIPTQPSRSNNIGSGTNSGRGKVNGTSGRILGDKNPVTGNRGNSGNAKSGRGNSGRGNSGNAKSGRGNSGRGNSGGGKSGRGNSGKGRGKG